MKAIAAMAENRAIGKDGGLPWKSPIKEDFRWFKEFTTNKILIVGRKTFDTLPPLRDRNIIILSSLSDGYGDTYDPVYNTGYCYRSYDDVIFIIESQKQAKLVVAGGAKTYELFLPYVDEFYVTHVKGEYEADTFMPPFEHLFSKQEVIKEFDGHRVIRYSK